MSSPTVILYRYDASPFSHKVDNALLLKEIKHQIVNVSSMLPRPEITDYLGVTYRRIPVLAIGNDIYCDTSLIVSALERRFPSRNGYGTLFPSHSSGESSNTGLIKVFSKFYADNTLFGPATALIPWDKLPEAFLKDRSELRGSPINLKQLAASQQRIISVLSSHLAFVEEQLGDGRKWLFDTKTPGLGDVSIHFVFAWARSFKSSIALFRPEAFPKTLQWLARMSEYLKEERKRQGGPNKIDGQEAAELLSNAAYEPYDVVGFDATDAKRLGLDLNDIVEVFPEDTGRSHPTKGKVVALNHEEIIIEIKGSKGTFRCHFPCLGFVVKRSKDVKL